MNSTVSTVDCLTVQRCYESKHYWSLPDSIAFK